MKRKKFSYLILGVVFLLAFSLLGCLPGDEPEVEPQPDPEVEEPVTIGVSLLTREHEFYRDLEEGLIAKANELGFELVVLSADFNLAKQSDQLSDFIVKDVDAIIVCPVDSMGIGSSIAAANEAGIPVFTADIASLAPEGEVVSHIASDNTLGGILAGELMIEALKERGIYEEGVQVAVINFPEITSVLERAKGFMSVMEDSPYVVIVADISGGARRDLAMSVMEDIIISHPDLAGVFGINDDSALGAVAALEAAGIIKDVTVIGFDAVPEAREAIKAGKMFGSAVQHPVKIGEKTIETIARYLEGETVDPIIPIEVGVWTKDDA